MPDGYLDTTANYRNFGFDQTSVIGGYIQEYFLRVKTNSIRLEDQVNNALNTVSQETFKTPDKERKALIEALQAHFYNTQLATKFKAFVTGEQDLEHAIKYAIARFEAPDIGNVITDNGKARFAVPEPKPQTHINNFTLTAKNLLDSFKGNGLYPNLEELLEEYMTNVATREDFKPKAPTGFHL